MATKYYAVLTNVGAAKLANATALGAQVEITQMAVGDGNGALPTPNPAQTALVHEVRRAPLNSLSIDPNNANQIIAEQVIPEDVGGWWIREIGLFDKDGDMIAVANCAETYKPQLQEGSGRVQIVRMILIVSSTAAVTLKIDPSVVLATRAYVDSQIIEVKSYADGLIHTHEQSRNHPDATTAAKGFVQLNSSVADGSESQAATPKAVKIAMDNGSARLAKDRNLSDLPNTALARQNLELGDSSTRNVGTTAGTVASGDDARITGAMQKSQNGADIPDVAKFLQNLGLNYFGYEPSTGEAAIFNGNKNLRYFINNNNESGVASVDYGLLWGVDGGGKLTKGIIPVARLDGLSGSTGNSTTAVMSQKAVTDALPTVTQSTGASTTSVMSQKATTDAINAAKTTVDQSVGTSTTSVMSQNAVTSLVNDAASVGVNQLWNDVTSSRTVGINYTNTTGRPIMIAMNVKNVPAGLFASSITVQGIELSAGSTVSGEHRFISAIVPPGQVYRYQPLASSNFILLELR
ncbi:TPA: phage tail protein [Citrobacter farmeri]